MAAQQKQQQQCQQTSKSFHRAQFAAGCCVLYKHVATAQSDCAFGAYFKMLDNISTSTWASDHLDYAVASVRSINL